MLGKGSGPPISLLLSASRPKKKKEKIRLHTSIYGKHDTKGSVYGMWRLSQSQTVPSVFKADLHNCSY